MQIRLYNSSNNNHIALRFVEVETEQLVMPFMVGDDGEPEMHYQILQKIGSTETLVAQGFYADGPFRLSNLVVDGSSLKLYVNGVLWRTISITAMTVNRLELSGGAKRLLVDEMFVMPGIASKEDIESWYGLDQPFYDPNGVLQDKQIASSERWDQKARTFYQATAPTATAVGDLWVDTDDNNHLYRWDGTKWVDIQDKSPIPEERIPSAEEWNRKARTFYQSSPPTATGIGDIWFDTSDHNHRYWWDGAKWADVSDTSPVNANQRPIHAQGLGGDIYFDQHGYRAVRKADGKTMMHFDLETGSNYWEGDGVFRGRVEAEEGHFRGDITGASGTFADGRVAIGDLGGKPWGDGVLPAGTAGIWGDQAGVFLRGYTSVVAQGTVSDQGEVSLIHDDGGPIQNPTLLLSLNEIIIPAVNTKIFTGYRTNETEDRFIVSAKIVSESDPKPLPGTPDFNRQYTYYPITTKENGILGRKMSRVKISVGYVKPGATKVGLVINATNKFDSNGEPYGWETKHIFLLSGGAGGSGVFPDVDITFPLDGDGNTDYYALQFVDSSTSSLFGAARTIIYSIDYFDSEAYYNTKGTIIGPDDPSGLSVTYTLLQQG